MAVRIDLAKRKLTANFWSIAVGAAVGSLLAISFYMLVKAEVLYGLAGALRVGRGTLDLAGDAFGIAGLVVGIPSLAVYILGNVWKKY